jgi:hypothetical protein
MKLSPILLISAIALASHSSSLVRADEGVAVVSDAAADAAAQIVVDEAIEAAVDDDNDNDAGKECTADADNDCSTNTAAVQDEAVVVIDGEDSKCPSRPHVIRCAAKYLDSNHNGALERDELENAMKNVSWIVRGLLKVIGSVDSIMKKCDADGDGQITIEQDMEATKETCLATCFKRKAFKRLFFPDCTE